MEYILAPSILAADFGVLKEQIAAASSGGAKWLHFDVMDGCFVPSISFGMPVLESVRKITDMFLDVHLMIVDPGRYIDEFARIGADMISFHYEAAKEDPAALADRIHALGKKAGIVISPDTPAESIKELIPSFDMVLVMTVVPGAGGQTFIPSCLDKVRSIREWINEGGYDCHVEVDGGVRADNIAEMKKAGANVVVAGSAVFRGDPERNARELLKIIS